MRNLLALTQRELKAFWYSPMAYAVGAFFLLLQGWVFWLLVVALSDPRSDASISLSQAFFGPTFFYVVALLITVPLLTMRTFSEEKRTGTIEFLLTAPVRDGEVVLGKFLGAWISFIVLWASTIVFFLMIRRHTSFDWGPVLTGYLGTWLLGGALISIGILASSLTRNQAIAGFLAFAILLMLFTVGFLDWFVRDPDTRRFLQYLSVLDHLTAFSKGILDTRPLVFYTSLTAIMLFLTGRIVGSPRWRS